MINSMICTLLILGLAGHHTPFCSFGLKVLSKIIEGEKILPYAAREGTLDLKIKRQKKTHTMSYVVTRTQRREGKRDPGQVRSHRELPSFCPEMLPLWSSVGSF